MAGQDVETNYQLVFFARFYNIVCNYPVGGVPLAVFFPAVVVLDVLFAFQLLIEQRIDNG